MSPGWRDCCDETVSAQGGHGCQRVYALEGVSDGLKVTAGSVIQRDDRFSTRQLPMQPAPVVSCACRRLLKFRRGR